MDQVTERKHEVRGSVVLALLSVDTGGDSHVIELTKLACVRHYPGAQASRVNKVLALCHIELGVAYPVSQRLGNPVFYLPSLEMKNFTQFLLTQSHFVILHPVLTQSQKVVTYPVSKHYPVCR